MKKPIPKWVYVSSGVAGLIGLAALVWRLIVGIKITWLSSSVPWGAWVAFYIYFIGLSAGSFLFSTLIYVFGQKNVEKAGRLALLSAVFALVTGLAFVWMDLGHPWRFLNVFIHWNYTSVLAWESLFYIFYIVIVLLETWLLMRYDLAELRDRSTGWRKSFYQLVAAGTPTPRSSEEKQRLYRRSLRWAAILGAIGIPVAIGVHGGTGAIFAVVKARPYWYSPIFPIIFLVSALVSGAALMTFLYAFLGDRNDPEYKSIVQSLATWFILFLSIDLLLMLAEFLVGYYGGIPDHIKVLDAILFGPYWYVFWFGQMGLAVLVPILIYIFKRDSVFWLAVAGLSGVIGIISVRFNLVIPAFVTPPIPGLEHVFDNHPRLAFSYFPSPGEWVTSIGMIAFVIFLFTLAYGLLPMFEQNNEVGAS
ncbi:MAG: molybdopterin oxidoreductase [Calditrichaeota bacterium]|nr:MAG: molybdopterin oxidoreductase [Calditrichota bacterium]